MMKKIALAVVAAGILANSALAQDTDLSKNRALAVDAMTALFVKHDASAVERYFSEDYFQHNPTIPQGRDGLKNTIEHIPANFVYEPGRAIAEGNLVALHARITGYKLKPQIVVDIFRIKDGKIAEHWDVLQDEIPADGSVSELAMFQSVANHDEPKQADPATLKKNKYLVLEAMTSLFVRRDTSKIDQLYTEDYKQHNPTMPQGRKVLVGIVKNSPDNLKYEPGRMVAEGDLVAIHGRITGWGPKTQIVVDIFRIQDGKLAEHWDVMQDEIPANVAVGGASMFD